MGLGMACGLRAMEGCGWGCSPPLPLNPCPEPDGSRRSRAVHIRYIRQARFTRNQAGDAHNSESRPATCNALLVQETNEFRRTTQGAWTVTTNRQVPRITRRCPAARLPATGWSRSMALACAELRAAPPALRTGAARSPCRRPVRRPGWRPIYAASAAHWPG